MKVLIVDDHKMMRDGLRALLEKGGTTVVGEAENGREALEQAARLHPNLVLLDISMPELNGIDAARRFTAEFPDIKILALSMNADRRYVLAMLEAGAAGYLVKTAAAEELENALKAIGSGEIYLSPAVAKHVVDRALRMSAPQEPEKRRPLTVREREVLQLVAEGKSSKEIASCLNIAMSTVDTHRRQIMEKLDLRTIAELTKYAIREGLTSADV